MSQRSARFGRMKWFELRYAIMTEIGLRVALGTATVFGLAGANVASNTMQKSPERFSDEQSAFGIEYPVQKPAKLPDTVLSILKTDERVAACQKQNSAAVVPDWFVASEIHLSKESAPPDLIVQPQNECLASANIEPFWVFRRTEKGYSLALMTYAADLEVVGTRTHGYRDIRVTQEGEVRSVAAIFRFDGKEYEDK